MDIILPLQSRIVVQHACPGVSPAGFQRLHLELLPSEVGRLISYDPRSIYKRPQKPGAKPREDKAPHNISADVISLHNQVQRSIDKNRVSQMVDYLASAVENGTFADWGAIDLVTSDQPDLSGLASGCTAALPTDAEYFIADGQHRYCALLDFLQKHGDKADRFTQGVTVSILPEDKLVQWAAQKFHDHNFYSVKVRPGLALRNDTRDPINTLTKSLDDLDVIVRAGGIAYERDQLGAGDPRLVSLSTMHRMVRGFVFGREGLDRGIDTNIEISDQLRADLQEYLSALGEMLPWDSSLADRDDYLTRTSVVLSSLMVLGHEMYNWNPPLSADDKVKRIQKLGKMDWKRTNKKWSGIIGPYQDKEIKPQANRQALDATIGFLREKLDLIPKPEKPEEEK
jgi:DNA sulfur modification protein DndB